MITAARACFGEDLAGLGDPPRPASGATGFPARPWPGDLPARALDALLERSHHARIAREDPELRAFVRVRGPLSGGRERPDAGALQRRGVVALDHRREKSAVRCRELAPRRQDSRPPQRSRPGPFDGIFFVNASNAARRRPRPGKHQRPHSRCSDGSLGPPRAPRRGRSRRAPDRGRG